MISIKASSSKTLENKFVAYSFNAGKKVKNKGTLFTPLDGCAMHKTFTGYRVFGDHWFTHWLWPANGEFSDFSRQVRATASRALRKERADNSFKKRLETNLSTEG